MIIKYDQHFLNYSIQINYFLWFLSHLLLTFYFIIVLRSYNYQNHQWMKHYLIKFILPMIFHFYIPFIRRKILLNHHHLIYRFFLFFRNLNLIKLMEIHSVIFLLWDVTDNYYIIIFKYELMALLFEFTFLISDFRFGCYLSQSLAHNI